MSFVPTPFDTPVYAPSGATAYRESAYISVSEYRFAPTSVATQALNPGSNQPGVDSAAVLAQEIARASAWIDQECFHRGDGSFVAAPINEQMSATVKPDNSLVYICNFKPVRALLGMAIGPVLSQMSDIDQNTAANIIIGERTLTLPGGYCFNGLNGPVGWFGGWPSYGGSVLAVYTYVAGFPHTTLGASVEAGASSITVNPPVPGATTVYGLQEGNPLNIKDGADTETVVVSSVNDLTIELQSPLQSNHTVPDPPDALPVTALPWSIEQACVSIVNVLLKQRGARAQQLPSIGAATPGQKQMLARAGALADFDIACHNLKPFVTTYVHS